MLAVVLLGLVVIAALLGAGYAVTRATKSEAPKAHTSAPDASTSTSALPPAPAAATVAVVPFAALAVGTPPSAGVGDEVYPWYLLKASLHGPSTVTTGTTSDFRVELSNPTDAAISLDPCPSYDLSVGVHTMSYGLNCAGLPATVLAGGATVTFDIAVAIPHNLNSGSRTTVTWALGWQPDRRSPSSRLGVRVK